MSTKIHVAADTLGRPVRIILTGGERNDCTQAVSLIKGRACRYVIADKGYDTEEILNEIKENGSEPVIPPKRNRINQRSFNRVVYKDRNKIERMFSKLKQFRRVATRYERKSVNFLGMIILASLTLWLS